MTMMIDDDIDNEDGVDDDAETVLRQTVVVVVVENSLGIDQRQSQGMISNSRKSYDESYIKTFTGKPPWHQQIVWDNALGFD